MAFLGHGLFYRGSRPDATTQPSDPMRARLPRQIGIPWNQPEQPAVLPAMVSCLQGALRAVPPMRYGCRMNGSVPSAV